MLTNANQFLPCVADYPIKYSYAIVMFHFKQLSAISASTVTEHPASNPEFQGLNPAAWQSAQAENEKKEKTFHNFQTFLFPNQFFF